MHQEEFELIGMVWALQNLKAHPQCHTSSNKATSPNPSQTFSPTGDCIQNNELMGAILIHTTTDTKKPNPRTSLRRNRSPHQVQRLSSALLSMAHTHKGVFTAPGLLHFPFTQQLVSKSISPCPPQQGVTCATSELCSGVPCLSEAGLYFAF